MDCVVGGKSERQMWLNHRGQALSHIHQLWGENIHILGELLLGLPQGSTETYMQRPWGTHVARVEGLRVAERGWLSEKRRRELAAHEGPRAHWRLKSYPYRGDSRTFKVAEQEDKRGSLLKYTFLGPKDSDSVVLRKSPRTRHFLKHPSYFTDG